jgi:two-component system, sporulation sensor kinase E
MPTQKEIEMIAIDRRKQSLTNMVGQEQLYKDLFSEALDGIIFWSGNGQIEMANGAACRIFECCHEELTKKKIDDFVYTKDEKFTRIVRQLFREGAIRDELIFLMANGQKKSLEFTCKLHVVEGHHMTIFRNVSESRRMERELRESERKFRKVFEGALEGILLYNEDFQVVDINPAGESIFKIPKQMLIGQSLINVLVDSGISKYDLEQYFTDFLNNGQTAGTVRFLLENNGEKYIEFSTKQKIAAGLNLVVFKDITEKQEMEEQLRKSDTLHVIGELAAGIAHEIRNPMTALKGFIQLLEDSIKEDHSMYFNIISSELHRIDSIINEFLILAKPQAVKYVEKDITKIMKETVEFLNAQAVLHNVQFITFYEENLPLLYCEPNQMKKVFINLIKNAIEVMPKGGFVTISIAAITGDQLHISIKDEGTGIPEEIVEKLGEPFYTTKERGTGLGLMVTYKIIEEHKGKIKVESEMNKGTAFHIYLPIRSGRDK